jgi:hypothetical protein
MLDDFFSYVYVQFAEDHVDVEEEVTYIQGQMKYDEMEEIALPVAISMPATKKEEIVQDDGGKKSVNVW